MLKKRSYPDYIPTVTASGDMDGGYTSWSREVIDNSRTGVRLTMEDIRLLAQQRSINPDDTVTVIEFFAPFDLMRTWQYDRNSATAALAREIVGYIFAPDALACADTMLENTVVANVWNDKDPMIPSLSQANVSNYSFGEAVMSLEINLAEMLYTFGMYYRGDKQSRGWYDNTTTS